MLAVFLSGGLGVVVKNLQTSLDNTCTAKVTDILSLLVPQIILILI